MRAGDIVIYRKLDGVFEFGSEHTVQETCVVLDSVVVAGSTRIHKMSEFMLPGKPKAGEWWITRQKIVVLVASVVDDRLLVAVPNGESCCLEMYYGNGRYSQSQDTGFDLICRAVGNNHVVGESVNKSIMEEVKC
jgi:hypothetical protein